VIIDRLSQVKPLFEECLRWLKCQDYQFKGVELKIGLLPREQMASLANLRLGDPVTPLGMTRTRFTVRGNLRSGFEVDSIAIVSGLSEVSFRRVLIHELGHAWISLNEIQGLPLWVEEGFCELLSYQYLKSCNRAETILAAEQIMQQADQLYGDGFRAMRDFSYQYGINRLRDEMVQAKGLPKNLKCYVALQAAQTTR